MLLLFLHLLIIDTQLIDYRLVWDPLAGSATHDMHDGSVYIDSSTPYLST